MNMKKLILLTFCYSINSFSQVGIGTAEPNASSQLEVKADDKGVLLPQVALQSTTDNNTISNGNVVSLLVYNTNNSDDLKAGYYFWDGSKWMSLGSQSSVSIDGGTGAPDDDNPANPQGGDLYVDETNGDIYTHNGDEWVQAGSGSGSTTTPGAGSPNEDANGPSDPQAGDLYVDTDTGDIYTYSGDQWTNKSKVVSEEDDNVNDDIFSFALLDTLADPCRTIFKGVLTNKKTNLPIPNATLVFLNSKQEEVGRVEADEDGYYSYRDDVCGNIKAIRFLHDDYFADEVFVSGNEGGVVQTEIALDLRKLAIEEETTSTKTDLAMLLNPIYFDLNKSFIREDAKIELEKIIGILNQHPLIKIDVRAHTDSRGLDSFNLALSNRRAKSTIKYMIDRGIDPDRITGRGYGESELINNCSDGVVCQDYLHEQNRRSEFIIVKK